MRVCYYYQTFVGLDKIMSHSKDITNIIISSIHFDKDNNGTIEWEEFYDFFEKVNNPEEIRSMLSSQNAKFLDYKMTVKSEINLIAGELYNCR